MKYLFPSLTFQRNPITLVFTPHEIHYNIVLLDGILTLHSIPQHSGTLWSNVSRRKGQLNTCHPCLCTDYTSPPPGQNPLHTFLQSDMESHQHNLLDVQINIVKLSVLTLKIENLYLEVGAELHKCYSIVCASSKFPRCRAYSDHCQIANW